MRVGGWGGRPVAQNPGREEQVCPLKLCNTSPTAAARVVLEPPPGDCLTLEAPEDVENAFYPLMGPRDRFRFNVAVRVPDLLRAAAAGTQPRASLEAGAVAVRAIPAPLARPVPGEWA